MKRYHFPQPLKNRKEFRVVVTRVGYRATVLITKAHTVPEARRYALDMAPNMIFPGEYESEYTAVVEKS